MGARDVERLVEELHACLHQLGLEVPGPLSEPAVLDEIDAALTPARLPASVRRLWELVDADQLRNSVSVYPELAVPRFSLWSRGQDERDGFMTHPRHFFQLCDESHGEMSVECDGPSWEGGCLFEWFLSDPDSPFVLRFRSAEDWLEVLIAALRENAFHRYDSPVVRIDRDRHLQLAAEKMAAHAPHPDYGLGAEIPRDRSRWPEIWHSREAVLL